MNYYIYEITNNINGKKYIGKRVTKKDDKDVFIGFDFKSNWTFFGSQNGYPRLK